MQGFGLSGSALVFSLGIFIVELNSLSLWRDDFLELVG